MFKKKKKREGRQEERKERKGGRKEGRDRREEEERHKYQSLSFKTYIYKNIVLYFNILIYSPHVPFLN